MQRLRDTSRRGAALASCLVAAVAGCGSADRSEPRPSEPSHWASLGQSLPLDPDRPRDAVRRYVLRVAGSAGPFAVSQQAPFVSAAVGRRRMVRVLELAAATLFSARARAARTERRGRVAHVEVTVGGESLRARRHRFVLVVHQGRWLIAYDTFTRTILTDATSRRIVRRYLAAGRRAAEAG